jgi:hypothetical protein
VFANPEWEALGARVLHRFAAEEQTPDGYPFNPYANAPETALERAVAALSVPLRFSAPQPGRHVRPAEQEIRFTLEAEL